MPANSKYRGECGHCSYVAHSLSAMEKHLKSHLEHTDSAEERAGTSQDQSDGEKSDSENEACMRPDPEPETDDQLWEEWQPDNFSFNFHRDVDDATTEHHMGSCDTDMQHFRDLYTDSISDSAPSPPPTQTPSAPSPLPDNPCPISEDSTHSREGSDTEETYHQTEVKTERHYNSESESVVSLTLKLQCSDASDEEDKDKDYFFCAHCDFKSEVLHVVQHHTMSVHSEGIKSVVEADSWECADDTEYEQVGEEVDESAPEDMEEQEDNWEMVPDENHKPTVENTQLSDDVNVKQEPVTQAYSLIRGALEINPMIQGKQESQSSQLMNISVSRPPPAPNGSDISVYKCEINGCAEYFMTRDGFCSHVKHAHYQDGGKIFYCAYCRFAATDCNRVREHTSNVHVCMQNKPTVFLTPFQRKASFKQSDTVPPRFTCLYCTFMSVDQHLTIYHTYREHRVAWMQHLEKIHPGFSSLASNLGILHALPKLATIVNVGEKKAYVLNTKAEGMRTRRAVVDYAHLVNKGGVCKGCDVCDSVLNLGRRKTMSLLRAPAEEPKEDNPTQATKPPAKENMSPAVPKPKASQSEETNSVVKMKSNSKPQKEGPEKFYREHVPSKTRSVEETKPPSVKGNTLRVVKETTLLVVKSPPTTATPEKEAQSSQQGTTQPPSPPVLTVFPSARVPTTATPKSPTVAVCRRGCTHHQMLLLKNSNPALSKVLLLHELNGKVIHAETPAFSTSGLTVAPKQDSGVKPTQTVTPKTTLIVQQTPAAVKPQQMGAPVRTNGGQRVVLLSPTKPTLQSTQAGQASSQPIFSVPFATSTPSSNGSSKPTLNATFTPISNAATSITTSTPTPTQIQDSAVSSTVNKDVIKIEPDAEEEEDVVITSPVPDVVITSPVPEYEELPWDDTVEDNSYLYADQDNLEWLGQSETAEELTVNSFRRLQEEDSVIESPVPGPRRGRPKKSQRKNSVEEVSAKEVRVTTKPNRPKEPPPQPTRVSKRERKPNVKCLCEECRMQSLCRTLMLAENQHKPGTDNSKLTEKLLDDDQLPELVPFSGSGKKRKQWFGALDGPRSKQRSMSGSTIQQTQAPKSKRPTLLMDDPKLRKRPVVVLPDIMMLICSSR